MGAALAGEGWLGGDSEDSSESGTLRRDLISTVMVSLPRFCL